MTRSASWRRHGPHRSDDPIGFERVEVGGAPHDVGAEANGTWVSVRE